MKQGMKILSQWAATSLLIVAAINSTYALDAYKAGSAATGDLSVIGSDTITKAAKLWVEDFKTKQVGVNVTLTDADSGAGADALVTGKADIGMMSRTMKPQEILAFQSKKGYQPTQVIIGLDGLAIITHKENPIASLSIQQIDGAFSTTLKCGGKTIDTWGALGVTGDLAGKALTAYSREAKSGTRSTFEKEVLCKGAIKAGTKEFDSGSAMVSAVAGDPTGIGYASLAALNDSVKAIPVAKIEGQPAVAINEQTVIDQSYPLSRGLYLYVDKNPTKALDHKVAEMLRYAISAEGQALVKKAGYISITDTMAAEGKKNAGL